jgi:hypothetical protein
MRRLLVPAAALAAAAFAAAPAFAQTRDDDLQTLTVIQVDRTLNEIRVREPGSTRIRILELDEGTQISGGTLGGPLELDTLQPGDSIRVPGVAGSTSDRVRAERIQVLAAPAAPAQRGVDRSPRALDPGTGAVQPDSTREPGALDPARDPRALRRDPGSDPSLMGADPEPAEPGSIRPGADPDADVGAGSGRTRGTSSGGSGSGGGSGGSGGSGGGGGP